ncbi:MAG TPA: CHAT domain-containing tetratricopeptide repeat protein [Pyrinomonadaceae bacterium]|nr:CHAT domain-containing tetratricopeptide repeat protein [Pyrinomonadaceae bacterium]
MVKRTNDYVSFILRLAILCLALGGQSVTAQVSKNEPTPLHPGVPIERDLKGGDTEPFSVQLTRGQFLYVVVIQKGIDVEVALFGPDRQQIASMNSPNGSYGPEPVVAIAEASGGYRIEVVSPNKNAAGRYEIRIIGLRDATPADREHVAAERAFEEARRKLAPKGTTESRHAAIEKYKQALQFFQSSGDNYRQALTLSIIGLTYALSSDFQEALNYYDRALTLFRALKDTVRESSMLTNIGGAYDVLGDLRKAEKYYDQALLLVRGTKSPVLEAIILSNLGKIHGDLADWQKAIEYYDLALPLLRAAGEQRREGITLNNIGVAYSALGQPEKALQYFQQAVLLRRAGGDKAGEAQTLNNIGRVHAELGQTQKALDHSNQALALQRTAGDRLGEASTLNQIGIAHSMLGDQQKAIEFQQQSLQLRRAVGDRRGEGTTLNALGNAYGLLGQTEAALQYFDQALAIFRNVGDGQNEAQTLQGMARAERDRGNLVAARAQTQAALALIEQVRTRVGSGQLRASYLASEQDAFHFYIEVLMQLHRKNSSAGHDAEALQVSERARARSLIDLLTEARVDIRQGVDPKLVERERDLAQLLNAKSQRQLQLAAQKSSQDQLAQLNKEISALEDEYQQVKTAIRKNSPQYAALTQPEPLQVKEIQDQLDQDTLLLEYSLGTERSYVWAVTQNTLKTYELPGRDQIQKTAREVYELLTTRSLFKVGETATQRRERIAQADSKLLDVASELSQMLIGPVASELGNKRLVVVADGALQYVPFALLPIPRNTEAEQAYVPLVVKHEIISLPSASTIAVQRRGLAGRKLAPRGVAVIADPVFSATDDRLKASVRSVAQKREPTEGDANTRFLEHLADNSGVLAIRRLRFTRQEASQILAVASGTSNLKAIDFRASRDTVTSKELSKYRYVHFATHGYLDSERPDLSAVVLSLVDERGKAQDGFLRAHEIYNLDLPAELVVLSACETGLGKEIKGEGLVGLTRGFMYAGARRVVVSLWNVNDKATAELMQRFYRRMLKDGQTPAASLRAAQIEMWQQKQWQSPYFWAPFVLQGEWK